VKRLAGQVKGRVCPASAQARIAGLQHGLGAIPERWRHALAGRALVDPLADQLLASLRERAPGAIR
jgi:hypothetical protein